MSDTDSVKSGKSGKGEKRKGENEKTGNTPARKTFRATGLSFGKKKLAKRDWAEEIEDIDKGNEPTADGMAGKTTMEDLASMISEFKKENNDKLDKQGDLLEGMIQRMGKIETEVGKNVSRLDKLEKRMEEHEKRWKREDVSRAKRGLIILNLDDAGEKGNKSTTLQEVKKLGIAIGLKEDQMNGVEAWRMVGPNHKKEERKGKFPHVTVKFLNLGQKMAFMAGARNLKGDYKNVAFKHEAPKHLLEETRELESKCFDLRKSSHNKTKTRLKWKGDKLVAQGKEHGEKEFKTIDWD